MFRMFPHKSKRLNRETDYNRSRHRPLGASALTRASRYTPVEESFGRSIDAELGRKVLASATACSTDFNYKRSGGFYQPVLSPIEPSYIESLDPSPFHKKQPVVEEDKVPDVQKDDFVVGAEVLKVVSKLAGAENKNLSELSEYDVVDALLSDIEYSLTVPFAYRSFLAYAVSEFTDETVRFYKFTTDASKTYMGLLPFNIAKEIYDEFIVPGAPLEVNLSGGMKASIGEAIRKAEFGKMYVDIAVFDSAITETLNLMHDQTFSRYKKKVKESLSYANLVWSNTFESLGDFSFNKPDTIPLYNLFEDIQVGLKKLKTLMAISTISMKKPHRPIYKTPRRQNLALLAARDEMNYNMYHKTSEVYPSRMKPLRFDDY